MKIFQRVQIGVHLANKNKLLLANRACRIRYSFCCDPSRLSSNFRRCKHSLRQDRVHRGLFYKAEHYKRVRKALHHLIKTLKYKIVDTIAIVFEIEVSKTTANADQILKSGIYTREDVSLSEGDADKHIDVRIWVVQVFMWTSCIFIGKIFVFFQEIIYFRELLKVGYYVMNYLDLDTNP